MPLPAGLRIGPYEIHSALGQGGMGDVYRARDTKLGREVAIKVLPESLLHDADRVGRFEREARLLASLNHTNIAQVHGFEESAGVHALVMELVEGPTLADRIAAGPIPVLESMAIARQVAEALEAAHQVGIIHRDLKPANIKVRDDGVVKVLDFGLAKALEDGVTRPAASDSPTISPALTVMGVVLGTAAYMSPEQARGKSVDRRTDLWAFGCVLYEMLTGKRPFEGATASDVIARILEREPDWTALPADTPDALRALLRRCLQKDVKRRLDSAAAARIEIEEMAGDFAAGGIAAIDASKPVRRAPPLALVVVGMVAAAASAAVTWLVAREAAKPLAVTRFAIDLAADGGVARPINMAPDLAVSSDGTMLAYSVGPQARLMLRPLDRMTPQPVGIDNARTPFVSPDGRWLGFFDQRGSLKKVALAGGPALTLCEFTGASRGAMWGADNTIVFATSDTQTGLLSVPAAGGPVAVLTTPDTTNDEEDHLYPSLLPDGRGVVFTIAYRSRERHVAVLDARTGTVRRLMRGSHPVYTGTGHVLYVDAGTLWAVRFDRTALEPEGEAVPLVAELRNPPDFNVSPAGTLVYVAEAGLESRTLAWVDRRGNEEPVPIPTADYVSPRLAPDDARVVVAIRDREERTSGVWTWHFGSQARTRLSREALSTYPVWMPGGRRVIMRTLTKRNNIVSLAADGIGGSETLIESDLPDIRPTAVTADGQRVIFEHRDPKTAWDLMMSTIAPSARIEPLLTTRFDERNAVLSPNGRWIAYDSNETGREEVWVRPFPRIGEGAFQVSNDGGRTPLWSRKGDELFFTGGHSLYAVAVRDQPTFQATPPQKLFESTGLVFDDRTSPSGAAMRMYDVSRDGRRFLVIKGESNSPEEFDASIVVVQNWFEELKRQVP